MTANPVVQSYSSAGYLEEIVNFFSSFHIGRYSVGVSGEKTRFGKIK